MENSLILREKVVSVGGYQGELDGKMTLTEMKREDKFAHIHGNGNYKETETSPRIWLDAFVICNKVSSKKDTIDIVAKYYYKKGRVIERGMRYKVDADIGWQAIQVVIKQEMPKLIQVVMEEINKLNMEVK